MGRQAWGLAVIFSMGDLYQAGKLHGNGPNDRTVVKPGLMEDGDQGN